MLFQEIIEFVVGHITNPNKENAIQIPLADFAFIPEAEAGMVEHADAKCSIHTSGLRDPVRSWRSSSGYILPSLSKQRFKLIHIDIGK